MKIYIYRGILSLLILMGFNSCRKYDYDNGITTFGEVFFLSQNIVSDLSVKVNNTTIDWQAATGRIRVPEGKYTFIFYDKSSGKDVGEKTVNVVAGSPETYNLFQPTENDPVAFLNPNGQTNEEAANDGFIKLKIANYAGDLIPDELDIVVLGLNMSMETVELVTLESVTNNIGEEQYRQVPTGGSDILAYTFKFRNRKTQLFVKNHGGDDYWNQNLFIYPESMSPIPEKRVYTIYLRAIEQWGEFPAFIKSGDKYYDINPEILYAD
ncbi:hypothetical protein ACS126_06080 [Sphingobacterium lactis]|uniref:hypothetical protein n=1 Tax=Sphingobacterium TaxID=28453 RepID=UPI00257F24F5|nr:MULTISPECIES: hypothetical protein [Sphingobacterium]